jgi:predicted RNase H-like HicB family nuclease
MMKVVKEMRGHVDNDQEPDPTWEEAIAAFEAAEPAELTRPARKLAVVYRYVDGRWSATSPDLEGFDVMGLSLSEVRAKAAESLAAFLDPAVELDEHVVEPAATYAPRQRFRIFSGGGNLITVGSRGRGRAFISSRPARVSS